MAPAATPTASAVCELNGLLRLLPLIREQVVAPAATPTTSVHSITSRTDTVKGILFEFSERIVYLFCYDISCHFAIRKNIINRADWFEKLLNRWVLYSIIEGEEGV